MTILAAGREPKEAMMVSGSWLTTLDIYESGLELGGI